MTARLRDTAQKLLAQAGITIDGDKPYDIQVHDNRLYGRVFQEGTLGLGEAYMDGWWNVENLEQFFFKIIRVDLESIIRQNPCIWLPQLFNYFLLNAQRKAKAFQVAEKHYDIGNDLFEMMLGKTMVYTCAYWQEAKTLEEAQKAKLDLICKKLQLEEGMTLLDIGAGWGSLLKFAVENYGVKATGITVSEEQATFVEREIQNPSIEMKVQDYREIAGSFDRIVSVGMFEAVGARNYKTFMDVVHEHLEEDGLFLLHTIGRNATSLAGDPWFTKYIFPNGMIPSMTQITKSFHGIKNHLFVMEDWHNFGHDYYKTLIEWHKNFEKAWPKLKKRYDKQFYRMWRYYLLSSAAAFRARKLQLWQIVFSKNGVLGGYKSIR